MGVIILVTIGVDVMRRHWSNHSRLLRILFVVFLVAMPICRTVIRNRVWLSRDTLARSGLQALPNNAKMHYNYANLLAAKGQTKRAVQHYKTAVSLWPSYISAHNNLAHYMTNKTQALAHLTEVIRLQPCHANAYTNIADIYHRLLRFAIDCEKTNPAPHLSLATIHQELGELTSAQLHYDKALQLAPRQADVYYNVGLFFEKQDPFNLPSLRALARVHRKAGQNLEAEICFAKILEIRSDHATLDMVGTFYYNIGNAYKATNFFREAYALEPTEEIAVHLKAIHHYRSAIRLKPEDDLLQKNYKALLDLYHLDNATILDNREITANGTATTVDDVVGREASRVYVLSHKNDTDRSNRNSDLPGSVALGQGLGMLPDRQMSLTVEKESP
ncbi:hypothetical protein LSH36_1059g00016 [Paralvinella palmiformis]|uniref:Uncharacterized protein n=1 Tax=Paralvinella palmiformis TaxID=53620 RepID=A0AAD9IWJ5_9ANNE|nr:hypothetical protein LSH36_1059g00016 [Paralvinella palmiformis]